MKKVQLLHNPKAGNEKHGRKQLIAALQAQGYECTYTSVKEKEWSLADDAEMLIIAGGDGTVRKVVKKLLKRKENMQVPIVVLPFGTANNIAKTFGITGVAEELIAQLNSWQVKKFDTGFVENVEKENFFLEGLGFGIFPYLMKEMKNVDEDGLNTIEKKLQKAQELLYKIAVSYEPRYAELKLDNADHSGKFILVEVMNTRSIGPNLVLSTLSDPGDGEFEIVLIPEDQKEKFTSYIFDKLNGREEAYAYSTLKAKSLSIKYEGKHVHVDDRIVKLDKSKAVKIELQKGLLSFLVPQTEAKPEGQQ